MTDIDRTLSKTERNLWSAIVAEAMAHLKYTAFAHKALAEGHPEVAQIFQEVAGAENIHGVNHLQVSGEVKTSLVNLRNVIEGEAKEINASYPRMVRDAVEDGRTDAAETFTMAMDRERHHIEVFSKALEDLEAKLSSGDPLTDGEQTSAFFPSFPTLRRANVSEADVAPTYAAAREEVEGERWRVTATGRIREVVFGAQDGLISTLALVTAVGTSDLAATSSIVLVAGLAGALAGMLSMATGAYLGSKAQQDVQRSEIAKEAKELEEHPGEELAELIVLYQKEGLSFSEAKGVAEHIAADKGAVAAHASGERAGVELRGDLQSRQRRTNHGVRLHGGGPNSRISLLLHHWLGSTNLFYRRHLGRPLPPRHREGAHGAEIANPPGT